MNNTTENVAAQDVAGWRTNPRTGKTFRPDCRYGFVGERRRRNLPSLFRENRRRRVSRARQQLKDGKPGHKLTTLDELYLYSPDDDDLAELPAWVKTADAIFDPDAAQVYREWIHRKFGDAPVAWGLHLGLERGTHPHIIAPKHAGLPHLIRGSEKCKPVKGGDLPKVLGYVSHKHIPPTERNAQAYKRAVEKLGGKDYLPQTSGFYNCRLPKPPSFLFRLDARSRFESSLRLTFKRVRDDTRTKDAPKTNRPVQEKVLDAEMPVILRGTTPYEAAVSALFNLWQHRKLRGVVLELPDGTLTGCLETSLGAYFRKWLLLPSECEALSVILDRLRNKLQGPTTASWRNLPKVTKHNQTPSP